MGALSANSGLVRRVAFPREVLVFSNVLHACVQFSIEMGLLAIVLLIAGSPFLPWLPVVILISVLLVIFASGFALALSTLSVYFRDITYLWTIFIQVWFFLTPVVYAPSVVQDRAPAWVNNVLKLNPMSAFVNTYRDLLYDATSPSLPRLGAMTFAAFVSLAAGWAVFNRMGRRLPEEV
jgi:ABC-2 type transport system permease protein